MTSESARRIYGVDFSGAQDAGEKIWIAGGDIEDDELVVKDCQSAAERFGERKRDAVLKKLRKFVVERPESLFGFDFPFGLPGRVVDEPDWTTFIEGFDDSFNSPTHLREVCTENGGGHRLRATDELADAMCPYNIRIQYQTYYGISEVLQPLVTEESVSVFPMTNQNDGRSGMIEVYPAATLNQYGLCRNGYKEDTEPARKRRERNLDGLIECCDLDVNKAIRDTVAADSEGDALDSIVAACATFGAVYDGEFLPDNLSTLDEFNATETDAEYHEHAATEGHIYV